MREIFTPEPLTTLAVIVPEEIVPGSGFLTLMEMLPTWLLDAVPVAVSCVEETRVVVNAVEPKSTTALEAKCEPLIVNLKEPTGIEVGLIEEICGAGFSRVIELLAVFVESAVSVAVMVIEFVEGGNSGAVKSPPLVIVPVVLLPPATPLTLHATAVAVVSPVTCAENC